MIDLVLGAEILKRVLGKSGSPKSFQENNMSRVVAVLFI